MKHQNLTLNDFTKNTPNSSQGALSVYLRTQGFVAGGTGEYPSVASSFHIPPAPPAKCTLKARKDTHSSPFTFIAWLIISYHIRCSLGSTTCNMDMHPIKEITYCAKIKFNIFLIGWQCILTNKNTKQECKEQSYKEHMDFICDK